MEGSASYGPGGSNGSNGMSRAEKFEDEKRRIVDSCFGKRDEDGSLLESYITHIRIMEDSAYPSAPPPPESGPEMKKPRLIIVAVRKSGRVRMHKARENANGTFSIGKTWMLDDLSAVESFSGGNPMTNEEMQRQQWGGSVGFIVTLGKPYFWQASSAKEKQFFIASLVKIYTKYTGGKTPSLIGFDTREREQLSGVASNAARSRPSSSQGSGAAPQSYGQTQNQPARRDQSREPSLRHQPSRDAIPRSQPQVHVSQNARTQSRPRRDDSEPSSAVSSSSRQQNEDSLRRLAGSNRSQDFFPRNDDNYPPPRSRGGPNGMGNGTGRTQDRSVTPTSARDRATTPDSNFPTPKGTPTDNPPLPNSFAAPPERRRPPLPKAESPQTQRYADTMVPAPLASPRRDEPKLPMRSVERSQPRDRATEDSIDRNGSRIPDVRRKISEDRDRNDVTRSPAKLTPASPAENEIQSPPPPPEPEEELRPGLGPMIKKKSKSDIASSFMRAAKTANAFKPRAGGAAERMREALGKSSDGPDGITGVVPAPSLARGFSNNSAIPTTPGSPPASRRGNDKTPDVKISVPKQDRPSSISGPEKDIAPEKEKPREVRRPKPASEIMQKELASIGVDPSFLGGRGDEVVALWEDFGWVGEGVRTKNVDHMKEEIDRQVDRMQAQGWLRAFEEHDVKVDVLTQAFDKAIDECDELDGLLTLYGVELGTLNDDIAYIEAQSQGLQVQAANQKLLQSELKSLLETISISPTQLESLREASLETPRGLEQIEQSLVMLFKAMLTIDPSLSLSGPRQSEDGSIRSDKVEGVANTELGNMRVLQEKKDVYRNESVYFLRRLRPFLQVKFGAAADETRKALEREKGSNLARVAGKAKLDSRNHDLARNMLWKYSPLMLFSREINRVEWEELIKSYEVASKPLYQDEFREAVFAWKKIAKKPNGDEGDILFTSQIEKQTEGIASTARKLTVKRSQTLAKSLVRPTSDGGGKSADKAADGRLLPFDVFGGALEEMIPIMSMEQNFVVDFFHISSLEQHDFPDVVSATRPDTRQGGDLKRAKVMDPNRDLAKLVYQSMEEIYPFFAGDVQAFIDWSLQLDPLQGVGVLAAIEKTLHDLEDSNQEFLTRILQKCHTRLVGLFNKFVDEQVRAIEDTKVKIKKRKGVIGFIRIFPVFSVTLESMLASAEELEVRETINHAYQRINKAMFESLKIIARDNPGAQTAGADPEDKETLNYQILLIENMNHYLEEVDVRNNPVLEVWKHNAAQEMNEHMTLYLGSVLRRPLGKLLDFLESTESLMLSRQPGEPLSKISNMPSHSKMTFKKILAGYDGKEIRKGIETLKKRVEKHFGDADDPGLSKNLVAKVHGNCERYYEKVEDRILTIGRDVYDGDIMAEWTRPDVVTAFRAGK